MSEPGTQQRRWWKLHFSTKVVIAIVVIGLIFANVPGEEVTYVDVPGPAGKYGPDYSPYSRYEHGWPVSFMSRIYQFGVSGNCWMLNDRILEFHPFTLAADIAIALLVIVAATLLFEVWRRRRSSLVRFRLIELFGVMTITAIAAGWLQYRFLQATNEQASLRETLADLRERFPTSGYSETVYDELLDYDRGGPTFLRELVGTHLPFANLDHVVSSYIIDGNPTFADRFPRLVCIAPHPPGNHDPWEPAVAKLQNLETLDLLWTGMGNLSDFPPLPKLRGINLYDSGASERDLIWLSKCRGLEQIDLTQVNIGDDGLRHLLALKKLKAFSAGGGYGGPEFSEGCFELLAKFGELEDLWISGDFQGEAVESLLRLKKLKSLDLSSPNVTPTALKRLERFGHLDWLAVRGRRISDADIDRLQAAIPSCKVGGSDP